MKKIKCFLLAISIMLSQFQLVNVQATTDETQESEIIQEELSDDQKLEEQINIKEIATEENVSDDNQLISEESNDVEVEESSEVSIDELVEINSSLLNNREYISSLKEYEGEVSNKALYGVQRFADNPYSFQFVSPFSVIGAFYDARGAVHAFGFTQVIKNYNNQLEIELLYTSDMYYSKDAYLEVQFYKLENGNFYYDGYVGFDTYGENELILTSIIPYENYKHQEYIFMRIGTVNSYDSNYLSNYFDIKVYNPYYQPLKDTTPPTITLNGSSIMTVEAGETFTDPGASAYDDVDGYVVVDSFGSVDTSRIGTYTITYSAWDTSGNQATQTRTVHVKDTKAPIITLNGDSTVYVRQGSKYQERGASAYDKLDGNVSVSISGSVNTTSIGMYTLTYTATDKAGNTSKVNRTVKVISIGELFTDVEPNKWYTEHIMSFVKKQYINGYDDGTFKPQNSITRAEFVKIVNRTFGLTNTVSYVPFQDLDREWKVDEVKIALAAGYITPGINFRPNDPITRQEACKIVGVLLGLYGDGKMSFSDVNEIAPWAYSYVDSLVDHGVLSNNEMFRPRDGITRAEAVKILNIANQMK